MDTCVKTSSNRIYDCAIHLNYPVRVSIFSFTPIASKPSPLARGTPGTPMGGGRDTYLGYFDIALATIDAVMDSGSEYLASISAMGLVSIVYINIYPHVIQYMPYCR